MHHKRRKPKHQRAGCLMCKPHKDERSPKNTLMLGHKGFGKLRALYKTQRALEED